MGKWIVKFLVGVITFLMAFGVAGCSDKLNGAINQTPEPPLSGDIKSLIVYFSCSGNTQTIANYIKANTESEIYRILTVNPYPDDLNELYKVGQKELDENARPELTDTIEQEIFSTYDTIYLGYPIWGGTMPMAVYTFLESYDFTGKTIFPFCTHGGSGLGRTEQTIQSICENAVVRDGLSIYGSSAESSQHRVKEWLNEIGE